MGVIYGLSLTRKAERDIATCDRAGFTPKLDKIKETLKANPLEDTPGQHFERLTGNLKGYYSRHINYHNRVIYAIEDNTKGARDKHGKLYKGIVRIYRACGHDYDGIVLPS